jgi:hypothetical protein
MIKDETRDFKLDINKIKWDVKQKNFIDIYPTLSYYRNEVAVSGRIDDIRFSGKVVFSKLTGKLKRIEITIPEIVKSATTGSEVEDYINIYNVLMEKYGKPNVIKGINLLSSDEIKKAIIDKKNYPQIIWLRGNSRIVHTFRDYWGIIPYTYIVKNND